MTETTIELKKISKVEITIDSVPQDNFILEGLFLGIQPYCNSEKLQKSAVEEEEIRKVFLSGLIASGQFDGEAAKIESIIETLLNAKHEIDGQSFGVLLEGCAKTLDSNNSQNGSHSNGSSPNYTQNGNRPSYHTNGHTENPSIDNFVGNFVINDAINTELKGPINFNLKWREGAFLREKINRCIKDNPPLVILPFAKEQGTAALNALYACDTVGARNVIVVSAGIDTQSEEEVLFLRKKIFDETGETFTFVRQSDVFKQMDWDAIYNEAGISTYNKNETLPDSKQTIKPAFVSKLISKIQAKIYPEKRSIERAGPPKGSKGLTMLAGVIAAKALGLISQEGKERSIVFHDTDIINPYEYNTLEYLVLPKVIYPNKVFRGGYIARTGQGRNNEPISHAVNQIVNDKSLLTSTRLVALQVGAIIWQLTGERFISSKDIFDMPWTTGMSIESQINLFLAGKTIETKTPSIVQICNGPVKKENAHSDNVREHAIVGACAGWHLSVLKFINDLNANNTFFPNIQTNGNSMRKERFLGNLSSGDLKKFNSIYGGESKINAYQQDHTTSQAVVHSKTDYMLPTVTSILNATNLETIRKNLENE